MNALHVRRVGHGLEGGRMVEQRNVVIGGALVGLLLVTLLLALAKLLEIF